jgi:hypothetical protein
MGVIYASGLRTSRMDAVLAAIDVGAAAKLEIGTAGMAAVLATITLADPAGSVTGDVLTLTMPQSDTSADATGEAAAARIRTSADADVVTGLTVGTGSENIVLDSVSITETQTVTINSATITHNTAG